jgi:hypothetical protein
MDRLWIARPYRYADNVPWNDDRYEIFVLNDKREWVSVGGALRRWDGQTVAFLCKKGVNREIRTPQHAQDKTNGNYVFGTNVKRALQTLKWKYPNPEALLEEIWQREMAAF